MSEKNQRFILTDDDRAFLRREKDIGEGSAQNARTRIRTRLMCGLQDLSLLNQTGSQWLPGKFMEGVNEEQDDELYQAIVQPISLLYTLIKQSQLDVERTFEAGVREAEVTAEEVDVEIEVQHPDVYDFDSVRETIESGGLPSAWEIGVAAMTGDINETVQYGEEERTVEEWVRELADRRDTDEFIRVV